MKKNTIKEISKIQRLTDKNNAVEQIASLLHIEENTPIESCINKAEKIYKFLDRKKCSTTKLLNSVYLQTL